MKNYPIEKYKFFVRQSDNAVIAVSTYAGKVVKGIAKCAPGDKFNLEKGKELAAARCNLKIARKRLGRAQKKMREAIDASERIDKFYCDMSVYQRDALTAVIDAANKLQAIELDM